MTKFSTDIEISRKLEFIMHIIITMLSKRSKKNIWDIYNLMPILPSRKHLYSGKEFEKELWNYR